MRFKFWNLLIVLLLFNCKNKVEMFDEKLCGNVREIHTYSFTPNYLSSQVLNTENCNSKTIDSFNTNGQKLKTIYFNNEVVFRDGGLVRDENNRPKKELLKLYEINFKYDEETGLTKMTWIQKIDDITNSGHSEFLKKDRKIIEEFVFDQRSNLINKNYIHLDKNNIIKLNETYDRNTTFLSNVEISINDKGNIVRMRNLNGKRILEKETTFNYLKFDETGNWLEREIRESKQIKSVNIRDIFYYPN